MDTLSEWAMTIRKPTTRKLYYYNLRRLLTAAGLTPEAVITQVKEEARTNDSTTFARLIELSRGFKQTTAYGMVTGLRRFLRDKGVYSLPDISVPNPDRVKVVPYVTWEQALKICDAASRPYNYVFKLMLHCAWDTMTFLTFNTADTWDAIKAYVRSPSNPDYFRYNVARRKRSNLPFYTLIPMFIINEILASGVPTPFTRTKSLSHKPAEGEVMTITEGKPLDMRDYWTSSRVMTSAFKTARQRAAIGLIQGVPGKHELRDCLRSRAPQVGCASDVAEFALFHADPLGYNKCVYNEGYVWSEFRKVWGPAAVSETQLAERDRRIEQMAQAHRVLVLGQIEDKERQLKALDMPIYIVGRDGVSRPLRSQAEVEAEKARLTADIVRLRSLLEASG